MSELIIIAVGLAMDAFSVSVANGLSDTKMKTENIPSMRTPPFQ